MLAPNGGGGRGGRQAGPGGGRALLASLSLLPFPLLASGLLLSLPPLLPSLSSSFLLFSSPPLPLLCVLLLVCWYGAPVSLVGGCWSFVSRFIFWMPASCGIGWIWALGDLVCLRRVTRAFVWGFFFLGWVAFCSLSP